MHSLKINKYYKSAASILKDFRDPKKGFQIVIVVVIVLITWSGIGSIESNYKLQKQISEIEQQNQLQELSNQNVDLNNKYLQSNQYLELSARQNLGLANAGEQELLVPSSVAMSYTVPVPNDINKPKATPNTNNSNIQSWIDFLLHRNNFKYSS